MSIIVIDRFEEEYAVCELEDGNMINIEKNKFQFPISAGDVINVEIVYDENGKKDVIIYEKNEEEKQRRQQIIQEKMRRINRF